MIHTLSFLYFLYRNILDSDNYSPIPVTSEEMYKKVVGQFPFQDTELEKVRILYHKLLWFGILYKLSLHQSHSRHSL